VLTFKSSSAMTSEVLSHEGSHARDRQDLVTAIFATNLATIEESQALKQNLTKYETENRAYHNSSYVQEYKGTDTDLWQKGWKAVDIQQAIDKRLKESKVYEITPNKPGLKLWTSAPKNP
jgi:hypothetical protein